MLHLTEICVHSEQLGATACGRSHEASTASTQRLKGARMSPIPFHRSSTSLLAVLAVSSLAQASVTPLTPAGVDPSATIETFEGIAGIEFPLREPIPGAPRPQSDLPGAWTTPTGVRIDSVGSADINASVFDFSTIPGSNAGWSLGPFGGGSVRATTPLPSGTSFLAYENNVDFPVIEPLVLTFDTPVVQVGAFTEAVIDSRFPEADGRVVLAAFDSDDNLLGSTFIFADGVGGTPPTGPATPLDSWIGLETLDGSASIARVEITGNALVLDDLTFTVPSPSAAGVFLVAACLTRSRRR